MDKMQHSQWMKLTFPTFLALALFFVSITNYLLFHFLAELFAVFIAFMCGVVAWNTYPFSRNTYIMYIGCGYIWIGVLDLIHAVTFPGMGLTEFAGINHTAQIWVATRYLEAFVLLTSIFFIKRIINPLIIIFIFAFFSIAILISINFSFFPSAFIEGEGLTSFKIQSEYIVIVILIITLVLFHMKRQVFERTIYLGVSFAIVCTVFGEICFTLYSEPDDLANLSGHILKIYSYWFIYVAIVKTALLDRFSLMSKSSRTFDAIPESVVVIGQDGVIRNANIATSEYAEKGVDEIVGQHVHPLFHDRNIEIEKCELCQAIHNETRFFTELTKLENNKVRWIDVTLSPTYEISHMSGVIQVTKDITKRKKTELALIEKEKHIDDSNKKLQSILSNMQDLIFRTDLDGVIKWVSRVPTEITGYTEEDVLNKNIRDIYKIPEQRGEFINALKENGGKVSNYEIELLSKAGQVIWVSANAHLIYDGNGDAKGIEGSVRDVTGLKKAEKELIAYKDHLQELVSEQTIDLVDARDQAQAAEKAMSTFLANMSHELRTPLHGILSFANFGIKKIDKVDNEKLLLYFSRIEQSGKQLLRLLNDLLDLSKLRAGKMTYEYSCFNLQDVISKVILEFSGLNEEKEIEIILKNECDGLMINADKDKIAQVIRNLLSNAWKFSPKRSEIHVQVSRENGFVILQVTDAGIGIPEQELQTIFNAFEQSSKTSLNAGGTGLGLPICKEIIEHGHDGSIWAENVEPNGARFIAKFTVDQ